MNNYEVAQCKCGEVIVVSETGTIKVAGWKALKDVVDRLERGESLETVAKDYCSYCLATISSHASQEEHSKHLDWLPYHEPQPQETCNRYC